MSTPDSQSGRVPRIGIAPTRHQVGSGTALVVKECYLAPIRAAGAASILLAVTEREPAVSLLAGLDGLLLPGGGDLHPRLYGEEPRADLRLVDDDIGELHVALARAAHDSGLPTLGICLGCQAMAVARGGTLIQDLPSGRRAAVQHESRGGKVCEHTVSIDPSSRLFSAVAASQIEVPSQHHQAVDRVGEELKATAYAPDNVIEAIEAPDHPFYVGVQWHAELVADTAATQRLFSAFVRAAVDRADGGVVDSPR